MQSLTFNQRAHEQPAFQVIRAGSSPMHTPCPTLHCFNVVTDSAQLTLFAGVLTGLTFPALIFLADRNRPHTGRALAVLMGAFIFLALTTYLYATAASEETPGSRAVFVSFAASVAFAIALEQLFLGVAMLVQDAQEEDNAELDRKPLAQHAAYALSNLVVVLIYAFLARNATDSAGLLSRGDERWGSLVAICAMVSWAILCLPALANVRRWRNPVHSIASRAFEAFGGKTEPGSAGYDERVTAMTRLWIYSSAGAAVTVTALAAWWGERSYRAAFPSWGYIILMLLVWTCSLLYTGVIRHLFEPRPCGA